MNKQQRDHRHRTDGSQVIAWWRNVCYYNDLAYSLQYLIIRPMCPFKFHITCDLLQLNNTMTAKVLFKPILK